MRFDRAIKSQNRSSRTDVGDYDTLYTRCINHAASNAVAFVINDPTVCRGYVRTVHCSAAVVGIVVWHRFSCLSAAGGGESAVEPAGALEILSFLTLEKTRTRATRLRFQRIESNANVILVLEYENVCSDPTQGIIMLPIYSCRQKYYSAPQAVRTILHRSLARAYTAINHRQTAERISTLQARSLSVGILRFSVRGGLLVWYLRKADVIFFFFRPIYYIIRYIYLFRERGKLTTVEAAMLRPREVLRQKRSNANASPLQDAVASAAHSSS